MSSNRRKPIIGVTGPIASGKSLVASILQGLGCAVIDSDAQGHQLLSEPAGVDHIRTHFGRQCIRADGTVDRHAVADVIFDDVGRKQQLEEFLYPQIAEWRKLLVHKYQADTAIKAIVLESALLIEIGLKRQCDHVILVHADLSIRIPRVEKTRFWRPEELLRREKFFWPVHLKCSIADDIVYNNSTVDTCRRQVEEIFSRIISSAACQLA